MKTYNRQKQNFSNKKGCMLSPSPWRHGGGIPGDPRASRRGKFPVNPRGRGRGSPPPSPTLICDHREAFLPADEPIETGIKISHPNSSLDIPQYALQNRSWQTINFAHIRYLLYFYSHIFLNARWMHLFICTCIFVRHAFLCVINWLIYWLIDIIAIIKIFFFASYNCCFFNRCAI
jgi:hypothetical protein